MNIQDTSEKGRSRIMGFHKKSALSVYSLALLFFMAPDNGNAALDQARKAGMVPHKALYDVQLSAKSSGATVTNITGKMFYEWQPSCDAWLSNHRFDMTYEYSEAPSMRITSDFSSYESFDGKTFTFTSQRKRGGVVFEQMRGNVELGEDGKPDKAVYSIPDGLSFDLPQGTLFPIAHTLDVIDKAQQGEKFYTATIFDGSDETGPVEVNTFIGKSASYEIPKRYKDNIASALVSGKAWNVRLAFFPLMDYTTTSDYEMSLIFHQNGVISDMEVEYDDFSVTQKLVALERLGDACNTEDNIKKTSEPKN